MWYVFHATGKYPLLREGGWRDDEQDLSGGQVLQGPEMTGTFVYQSCSGPMGDGTGGTFGGELVSECGV